MTAKSASLAELIETFGGMAFALEDVSRGRRIRQLVLTDPRLRRRPTDVQLHSGRVRGGELFAALSGLKADGWRYAPDAVKRGAVAILAAGDRSLESLAERVPGAHRAGLHASGSIIAWLHPRAKEITGAVASVVQGSPSETLRVAGVTGTNGKTSVCHFVHQMLSGAGQHAGLIGTAGHTITGPRGPLQVDSTHTTPDPTEIQRLLARHRGGGGTSLVMEVSSHALVQHRLAGIQLAAAGFTNLTAEHLDYHGSMERYLDAKARVWDSLVPGGAAVIFGHSDASLEMRMRASAKGARVVTVDIDAHADVCARGVTFDERGATFELHWDGADSEIVTVPLKGAHNVDNALVAAALAHELGASRASIMQSLRGISAPPGRLEPVPVPVELSRSIGGSFDVLVDYAHTTDAMERVLAALRDELDARPPTDRSRLLCVFGCGGDRDPLKREPMGRAAGRFADVTYVTTDNPRTENPAVISEAIACGIDAESGRRVIELDRRRAIERSLASARAGDVVLIAGKGHENTQLVKGNAEPFDDRVVAAETLTTLAESAGDVPQAKTQSNASAAGTSR